MSNEPAPAIAGPYSLVGKVAVVTGAARGIGRAVALRLAAAGADVAIVDKDLAGAKEFDEQLTASSVVDEVIAHGRRSTGFEADLADRARGDGSYVADRGAVRHDRHPRDSGGRDDHARRSQLSITRFPRGHQDDLRRQLPYDGQLRAGVAEPDEFRRRDRDCRVAGRARQSQGALVTSELGHFSRYTASKAAVVNFTRSLAAELGPEVIRVNTVAPGITATARVTAQAKERRVGTDEQMAAIPLRRFAQPDDIARAVEFLASDMSSYVTGQCLSVCGGVVLSPS